MSKADVTRFLQDVRTDNNLQSLVQPVVTDVAALVAVLASRGYDITADDVKAHMHEQRAETELSDQELERVAGGDMYTKGAGGSCTEGQCY